jgi:uncharacterized circularly permuted ATP-grasp superfamily protein
MQLKEYLVDGFYDELFEADCIPRDFAKTLIDDISKLSSEDLLKNQKSAESLLMQMGVTFTVYGDKLNTEKIMPFDVIPRLIKSDDWNIIEAGIKQRIQALNLFITDIYNDKKIIKDGIIPEEVIKAGGFYYDVLEGFHPPKDIWVHISGIDIVRNGDGIFYVLEDNLRCPSGISYVLENRNVLKRTLPEIFDKGSVRPVSDYPSKLFDALKYLGEDKSDNPTVVVLTPGIYNSAYFEHSFLAQQMGIELVEGRDLVVEDDFVYTKTTKGLQRVDVIYRRIDDEFLDPEVFNPESLLGVPGIMKAYLKGNVALVNAPGVGIADDKALYPYVPDIIKYYLGEDSILFNVPTYSCSKEDDRKYVLENISELVVKSTNLSGGYGILIGSKASEEEKQEYIEKIKANPHQYVAQPILNLSTVPTLTDDGVEPRHVDLRPYAVCGEDIFVTQGGLTRVALKKGSLIVNSSQGGGSKDTWVVS